MAESDVQAILRAVAVIDSKLDHVIDQGEDHEERLRCLEQKGGKRWEAVTTAIFSAIIGALVTGIAALLITN
ncbi:MAG TPA: hypothetical protein PKW29_13910 [Clostridia bacterium]|nr:hypothetical protein [Clostridia bacterium]